jgi:acetoin utilization deacetylase AcuC-like enzyme
LIGDPICEFLLVKEDYYDIGKQLHSLNLPTLIIQEGGYSDDDILGPVAESLFLGLLNK